MNSSIAWSRPIPPRFLLLPTGGFIPLPQSVIECILLNPSCSGMLFRHLRQPQPASLVFFLQSPGRPPPPGIALSRILPRVTFGGRRCRPFVLFAPALPSARGLESRPLDLARKISAKISLADCSSMALSLATRSAEIILASRIRGH